MADTNRSAPTPARLLDLRDALEQEALQLRAQLVVDAWLRYTGRSAGRAA